MCVYNPPSRVWEQSIKVLFPTKRKKGEGDDINNQIEDKQWKDMEKTEKKADDIMEKLMLHEEKIKKAKGCFEWEVMGNKEKEKHVKSKKKGDDKTQRKYDEEKEKVMHMKVADNQQKYTHKHAEKLKKCKEGVKISNGFPQFFMLISPEEITGKLRIPLAFNTFLESECLGAIHLKGPSGNIWKAKLVLDSDGLCFVNGWKEFSIDHHLESGDFLVFRYDGHSQFSILVFDTTNCEKKSALDAYPVSTLFVESNNAALGIDAIDTSHHYAGDSEGSNARDTSHYNEFALCIDGTKTQKVAESDRSINGTQASQNDIQENSSLQKFSGSSWKAKDRLMEDSFCASMEATIMGSLSNVTLENYGRVNEGSNTTGHLQGNERTMASAKIIANDIGQEESESSRKTKGRWSKEPWGTSLDAGSSTLNSMKGVAKVPEPKVFISQRLVIAEKDKENTLKGGSDYPFFQQIMKATDVCSPRFMIIPSEFVRKYLPKVDAMVTLWDRQGRPWEVNYVYYKAHALGAFSGGWDAFVLGNSIEKDDICLFELFQENNIKVGVFGVVQETNPCIPTVI